MMKNEADIVESFIRHTSLFADKIYVCDHKSTDRTHEILESLKDEGLPIEISTFERDEYAQSEVTNGLINRAFEDNFDLVLLLDADEFLIYIDGGSNELRAHLQSLDINQLYETRLWAYRFADSNDSEFALSRHILRYKFASLTEYTPKIFMGRGFWFKYNPTIDQGNHGVSFSQPISVKAIHDESIHYAHFDQRSPRQLLSKYSNAWLNTLLYQTRYSADANHCKKFIYDYMQHPDSIDIDLTDYESIDLPEYKNECVLKYSGEGSVNSFRNIFLLAESYANIIVKERILAQREIVRIFLLFDGDVERTIQSLNSIFDQTYPFKKIVMTLLTTKNLEQLYRVIQQFGDRKFEIEFVYKDDFQSKLRKSEGTFVQFLIPGDKLFPEKIMNSVEFMHSDPKIISFFCEFDAPKDISMGVVPTQIGYPFKNKKPINFLYYYDGELYAVCSGTKYFNECLSNDMLFASGLSRGFFSQKVFDNIDWINDWLMLMDLDKFCLESSSMFFILNMGLAQNFIFLNETLVTRGAREWTEMDFQHHCQIYDLIARVCSEGNAT